MSARYQFYFDGALVSNPTTWDTLLTSLKRDEASRGLLITQDASLEFTGAEYAMLYAKLTDEGFCSYTDVEILESCGMDDNYVSVFKGVIFTSDCEFLLDKCTVTTRIQDNSFYAKINGNKSLEAFIYVGRPKNDMIAITPCAPVDITFFFPCDPSSTFLRKGYRVYDVLKFLVAYMTDDEVAFDSPVFKDGGEFEGLCISSGKMIRDYNELKYINKFSFAKAFENLWKKLNLGFYIDYSTTKPTLIMDYNINLFSDTQILSLEDVPGIKVKVDVNKLYSAVKFGSGETMEYDTPCDASGDYATGAFPDQIDFVGCKNETYTILGKCNIDRTLDLATDWIVSSNVIQYLLNNAPPLALDDNSYDDSIVLVDCDKTGPATYEARKENNIGGNVSARAFYNVRLFNNNVAKRFFGDIPLSIAKYLGDGNDVFIAEKSIDETVSGFGTLSDPMPFQTEITDPNSNYDNTNYWYETPLGGLYTFGLNLTLDLLGFFASTIEIYFDAYDSGATLITSTLAYTLTTTVWQYSHIVNVTKVMFLNAGLRVRVRFDVNTGSFSGGPWKIRAGGTFQCVSTSNGGGTYQTYNPDDYPVINYMFQFPLSPEQKKILKEQPFGKIALSNNGKTFYGWANDIKTTDVNGMTDFILISKRAANA